MARRIIYDPSQFIEASTPFFENVVGTITDQADRISRNLAQTKEKRAIAEERAFQVGLVQQRQQFQTERQEDSQEFQSEQARIDRYMQDSQFGEMMDYRWATLQQRQWMEFLAMQQQSGKQQSDELKALEKQANKMLDNIKSSGLTSNRFPNYFHVTAHPETGKPVVGAEEVGWNYWENFNNPNSRISFLSRLSDYMGTEVNNFRRKLADPEGGFAVREVKNERGEVVPRTQSDVLLDSEGNLGIGEGAFWEMVSKVRDGVGNWQEHMTLLEKAMSSDNSVQFLFSDSPQAKQWNQQNVNTIVGKAREAVTKGRHHTGGLLNAKGAYNNGVDEEIFEELYPNLIEQSDPSDPNVMLPAKTIGGAQQAVINQFIAFQDPDDFSVKFNPVFEEQWPHISKFRDFMVSTVEQYGDEMNIPDELKGKSAGFIVDVAYVNENEFMKQDPDPTKLLRFESDKEKLQILSEMNEFNLYDDVSGFMNLKSKAEAERQARRRIDQYLRNFSAKGNYIGN